MAQNSDLDLECQFQACKDPLPYQYRLLTHIICESECPSLYPLLEGVKCVQFSVVSSGKNRTKLSLKVVLYTALYSL